MTIAELVDQLTENAAEFHREMDSIARSVSKPVPPLSGRGRILSSGDIVEFFRKSQRDCVHPNTRKHCEDVVGRRLARILSHGINLQKGPPGGPITYFLQDDCFHIKIGFSTNWGVRRSTLQTGNAGELRLIGWIPGNHEKALHRRFRRFWIRREWFTHHILSHIN